MLNIVVYAAQYLQRIASIYAAYSFNPHTKERNRYVRYAFCLSSARSARWRCCFFLPHRLHSCRKEMHTSWPGCVHQPSVKQASAESHLIFSHAVGETIQSSQTSSPGCVHQPSVKQASAGSHLIFSHSCRGNSSIQPDQLTRLCPSAQCEASIGRITLNFQSQL